MSIDRGQPHYRIALDAEEGTVVVCVQDFDYADYKFANHNVYETLEEAVAENWQTYDIRLSSEDDYTVVMELTIDEARAIEKFVRAATAEADRVGGYVPSINMKRHVENSRDWS